MDTPRRRWCTFSLRTMFVVVTVLGVFLGWLMVQWKWIRDRHEALQWVHPSGFGAADYRPAPWSIRLVERGVPFITVDPHIAQDSEKIHTLKRLFPEATVSTPFDGLPLQHSHHQSGCLLKTL